MLGLFIANQVLCFFERNGDIAFLLSVKIIMPYLILVIGSDVFVLNKILPSPLIKAIICNTVSFGSKSSKPNADATAITNASILNQNVFDLSNALPFIFFFAIISSPPLVCFPTKHGKQKKVIQYFAVLCSQPGLVIVGLTHQLLVLTLKPYLLE